MAVSPKSQQKLKGSLPLSRSDDPLDRAVWNVCESAGAFIEWWGFKAAHGRIWTLIALHRAPLSQADIAKKAGISKALVSSVVSDLMDYGLVKPVTTHRNSPYQASLDVWSTIVEVLRSREWMLIESARVSLEGALAAAKQRGVQDSALAYDIEQMQTLLRMTEAAQGMLTVLTSVRMTPAEGLHSIVKKASGFMAKLKGSNSLAVTAKPAQKSTRATSNHHS